MIPLREQEKLAIVKSVLAVIFTNGGTDEWKKDVISSFKQRFDIDDHMIDMAESMSVDDQIKLLGILRKEQKEKLRNFLGEIVTMYYPHIADDRIYKIICSFMHISPFVTNKKSKHRNYRSVRAGEGAELWYKPGTKKDR